MLHGVELCIGFIKILFLFHFSLILTHLYPIHPFSSPWKHQRVEKGCIGNELLDINDLLFVGRHGKALMKVIIDHRISFKEFYVINVLIYLLYKLNWTLTNPLLNRYYEFINNLLNQIMQNIVEFREPIGYNLMSQMKILVWRTNISNLFSISFIDIAEHGSSRN